MSVSRNCDFSIFIPKGCECVCLCSPVELRDALKKIIKDAEDEELRLLVKIAKAVTR